MIYYNVLFTLTVICIISCNGANEKQIQDCQTYLKSLGFSEDYGVVNHCIIKQFKTKDSFKKHQQKYVKGSADGNLSHKECKDENIVDEEAKQNDKYLNIYFEHNTKIPEVYNIKPPLDYCNEQHYDGHGCFDMFLRVITCNTPASCEKSIKKSFDEYKVTNEKIWKTRAQMMKYYKYYVNDGCDYAIKAYDIHMTGADSVQNILQKWPKPSQDYYNFLLDKSKIESNNYFTSGVFLNTKQFCSTKIT